LTELVRLDYPRDEILMIAETEVEKTKRAGACAKERETVEFVESIPAGSVFYDLGANVGSYTLIALSRGLEVVAFEASLPNFTRLNENIRLNGFTCKTVCPPLWKEKAEIEWVYSSEEPGAALHFIGEGRGNREAFPLDHWTDPDGPCRLPLPDYVKIDLDGCEAEVIQGGSKTLRWVQKALVEHDEGVEAHKAVPKLLEDLGLYEEARYPHGSSPVSNVMYGRR
jgi:FkbM family methyltransferase